MAKVGFWLQGSKGKLSGASLSNGKNGSIIRAIVTPKNPRTDKQMSQRVIFATIAKAASVMKPIINHSFEGLEDGDACIKEFRKLNLVMLRNRVASDIALENQDDELRAYLAPKGYPYITPNAYIVSKGTLAAPALVSYVTKVATPEGGLQFDVASPTVLMFIQAYLGMNPGEQLTQLVIKGGYQHVYYDKTGEDSPGLACYENNFAASRIVFKDYVEGGDWDQPILSEGALNVQNIKACCDSTKTDMDFLETLFSNFTATVEDNTCTLVQSLTSFGDDVLGSAYIRSKENVDGSWNYSNASIMFGGPVEGHNFGLPLEEAVKTYTSGVSVGKDNRPFLDEGQNGGSLSISSFE